MIHWITRITGIVVPSGGASGQHLGRASPAFSAGRAPAALDKTDLSV
jgi:hypothetical protein